MTNNTRYLRGSTQQCPRCGSRKVACDPTLRQDGYGPGLALCLNCKTLWEPFDPAQVWDKTAPHCSFREPCNNCAFRPGSPEQADPEKWKLLLDQLKCGGQFFCHKGVPIDADAEHGFAYPTRVLVVDGIEGVPRTEKRVSDSKKLRLCRGYLNAVAALHRAFERESKSGKLDVLSIVGDPGTVHK